VAENARRWIFVHAGVVAWRGQAIVIPGATQSGKTSLVAALVRAGAEYFSDEYAVFDARGRVHPLPRGWATSCWSMISIAIKCIASIGWPPMFGSTVTASGRQGRSQGPRIEN
jgi:hypothetical protein